LSQRRRAIGYLLRVAVCGGLIAFVLSRIDLQRLLERLRNLDAGDIALILVVALAIPTVAAVRWRAVLDGLQMPRSLFLLWRLFLSSIFFGAALPYGGEDATRAWLAHRTGLPLAAAIRGVVIDRALAGCALVLIALPLLPFTLGQLPSAQLQGGALAAAAFSLGVVLSLALLDLVPLPARLAALRDRHLGEIPKGLRRVLADARLTARVLLPAAAVHVLRVVLAVTIAGALGLHLALADAMLLVPLALLVASAPVTLNGWGLREGIFALVLPSAGIAPTDAVAIAVCLGLASLAAALIGGAPAWLSLRGHRRTA
jgi:glycosyltransferase 2 family protein